MTFRDLLGAIEDMLEHHGSQLDDLVYIEQPNGKIQYVDGFHFEDGKVYIK
jgi:hypothetical protein